MRAFAGGFYNHLQAMYDYLAVEYHEQPFLFTFSGPSSTPHTEPYFIHSSNNHHFPPLRPKTTCFVQYSCRFLYLLACYIAYTICCFLVPPQLNNKTGQSETYGEYLHRIRLPQHFVDYLLVPLLSSVTTCPHKSLLQFPAVDLINYKKRTHGAPHFTVSNGVHTVQEKLSRGLKPRFSTTVLAVQPQNSSINVTLQEHGDAAPSIENFDRVILAVPPNVVGKIFPTLKNEMQRIPTIQVQSVVHNATMADYHSSINVSEKLGEKKPYSTLGQSQIIHLQTSTDGLAQTESAHVQPSGVTVTTCPISPVQLGEVIRSATFTRVLRTPESRDIVNTIFEQDGSKHGWKNGQDGIWLAGGWCWDGLVLLEGCEVSAMRIADAFGVEVPWRGRA